ncbi:MAG: hypothetical protein LWW85_04620 [Marinilabiliales bacterium]|nr:hypothetical protein [Marinilabiliales bacterium]
MSTDNHFVDKLFREKLEGFEQTPPATAMEGLFHEMDRRSKTRRLTQYRNYAAIAASIALIAFAGWYASDYSSRNAREVILTAQQQVKEQVATPNQGADSPALPQAAAKAEPLAMVSSHAANTHASKRLPAAKQASESPAPTTQIAETVPAGSGQEHPSAAAGTDKTIKMSGNEKENKSGNKSHNYFADLNNFRNENKDNNRGNWSVKLEVSPMFSSQSQSGSKATGAFGGGMLASFKLNDKVTISSGVRFSQMNQSSKTDYTLSQTSGIIYLQPVEKSANLSSDVSLYLPSTSSIVYSNGMRTNQSNIFVSELSQQFKYLEIPFQATYKLFEEKVSVGLTGGISTNILVGNAAAITENGIKLSQGSTSNLRNVLYSGSAGLEFGYGLGKRMTLTVEPRVKQYLHSISSNDQVNFKPIQFGVFTGITYSFD